MIIIFILLDNPVHKCLTISGRGIVHCITISNILVNIENSSNTNNIVACYCPSTCKPFVHKFHHLFLPIRMSIINFHGIVRWSRGSSTMRIGNAWGEEECLISGGRTAIFDPAGASTIFAIPSSHDF